MKVARQGIEFCVVDETTLHQFTDIPKIHLIKLAFKSPTVALVDAVFSAYKTTNRFIVEDNVKFYNNVLRDSGKKYYVENQRGNGLVSFFKRNNKCVLNLETLSLEEKNFVLTQMFEDVLSNLEVIMMTPRDLEIKEPVLKHWSGNVLLV